MSIFFGGIKSKFKDVKAGTPVNKIVTHDDMNVISDKIETLETDVSNINTTPVFQADIDVVLSGGKTLGKYSNGDIIPSTGLTSEQVFNLIATEYLEPSFNSFTTGISSTVEVGSNLTGAYLFSWSTSNSSNVQPNSIVIRDETAATNLATGLANDGSELVNIGTDIGLEIEGNYTYQIQMTDTETTVHSRNTNIAFSYYQFYGPTSANPTNSTEVRVLPSQRYNNTGNTFTLNTGTTLVKFAIAIPDSKSISSVVDLDALNTDITSQYTLIGTVSVLDAGGNSVTYKLYVMTVASPYSTSHRHQITLS